MRCIAIPSAAIFVITSVFVGACALSDYTPGDEGSTPDGGTGPDSGGPGPGASPGVRCGADTCGQYEVCCLDQSNPAGGVCKLSATCSLTAVPCDGPEDCTPVGAVCCGVYDGAQYTKIACKTSCEGQIDAGELVQICHADVGAGTGCAAGVTCRPETLLGEGYGYCDP